MKGDVVAGIVAGILSLPEAMAYGAIVFVAHPHARPQRVARSAAPRFHAATWPIRKMLEAGYRSYLDAYREAKQALADQRLTVHFPSACPAVYRPRHVADAPSGGFAR